MKQIWIKVLIILGLINILSIISSIIFINKVTYNVSDSEPIGYYWITKPKDLEKNKLYLICLKNRKVVDILKTLGIKQNTNNCRNGIVPLLKKIVAVPGDVVYIKNEGIYINKHLLTQSKIFHINEEIHLNHIPIGYKKILAKDEYWVMGQNAASYDSRYFGIINTSEFLYKALPSLNSVSAVSVPF